MGNLLNLPRFKDKTEVDLNKYLFYILDRVESPRYPTKEVFGFDFNEIVLNKLEKMAEDHKNVFEKNLAYEALVSKLSSSNLNVENNNKTEFDLNLEIDESLKKNFENKRKILLGQKAILKNI